MRQFPLHFPSRASPSAITFQLESTNILILPTVLGSIYKSNTTIGQADENVYISDIDWAETAGGGVNNKWICKEESVSEVNV